MRDKIRVCKNTAVRSQLSRKRTRTSAVLLVVLVLVVIVAVVIAITQIGLLTLKSKEE